MKLFLVILLSAPWATLAQETFEYPVFRVKRIRDEAGRLRISKEGLEYRAEKSKTSFRLTLRDLHEIDVSKPGSIRVETYDRLAREFGGRREYTFRLREGAISDGLVRFLVANVNRPTIGAYELPSPATYRLRAYHRHRLGGCHGEIAIGGEAVRFLSDKPGESRTWRYQDIETIGAMNAFHLRLSTLAEAYNFDLKERLPEAAYDFVFQRVWSLRTD